MQRAHLYRYLSPAAGVVPPEYAGQAVQLEYYRVSAGIVRVTIDHSEPIDSERWATVECAADDDMIGSYEPQNTAPRATRWRRLDIGALRAAVADE